MGEEYTLQVKRFIQQQPDTHSAAKKAKTISAIEHEAVCTANQDIAAERSTLKVHCTTVTVQKQLSTMELKSNVMKRKLTVYEPKRVNQKIKRKAAIIQQRNMQVKRLQCKIKKLETKLVTGDSRTDRLRRSNAQLLRKLAHHKKTDQKPRLNQSADLSSLKDKVSFLENATLSEHIQKLDNEKISAKVDGKKYSNALRRAIYHCVSKNVALENLESVIKSVVKGQSLARKWISARAIGSESDRSPQT